MRIAVKIDYFSVFIFQYYSCYTFLVLHILFHFFKSVNDENKIFNNEADETDEKNAHIDQKESFNESIQENVNEFEKYNCFYLYKKYIKEIFVRKKQFKDELLAACLEFFLSLPKELVIANLHEVFESLEVISFRNSLFNFIRLISF